MMYDPRNILKQSPETLRDLILTGLATLVILDVITISEDATAILGILIYKLLSVFYVAPALKAKVADDFAKLDEVRMAGVQEGAVTVNEALSSQPAVVVDEAVVKEFAAKMDSGTSGPPRRPRRVEK